MERPVSRDAEAIRDEKVKVRLSCARLRREDWNCAQAYSGYSQVLRSIPPITAEHVVLGQYTADGRGNAG
jgi:glucose-6-phosphate 1-dehydrogenase